MDEHFFCVNFNESKGDNHMLMCKARNTIKKTLLNDVFQSVIHPFSKYRLPFYYRLIFSNQKKLLDQSVTVNCLLTTGLEHSLDPKRGTRGPTDTVRRFKQVRRHRRHVSRSLTDRHFGGESLKKCPQTQKCLLRGHVSRSEGHLQDTSSNKESIKN